MELGTLPDNWLSDKSKYCKPLKFPIQEGMGPVRAFRFRYILSNLDNAPSESGNRPVRELKDRSKCRSCLKLPKELGMEPLMLGPCKRKYSNTGKLPMEGGRLPFIGSETILAMSPSLVQEK